MPRDVRELALEQADQLLGERVAHVVGVALEGEAEHGDLCVAQRAAEPRLEPLDDERGIDSCTRETASSMPGAFERSSENAKSLRRQVPAVKPGRFMPPRG